jgi:hypothetical protein
MILVDTPGLESLRSENSARSKAFLGLDDASASACAGADAVVFLVNQAPREDDVSALRQFIAATGARSGVATIGVLSQADRIRGGMATATVLASEQAIALRGIVSCVLPVSGLIAETFLCGRFTEDDAEAIGTLAASPASELAVMLKDGGEFLDGPSPIPQSTRRRLLELLDLDGVRNAISAVGVGANRAAELGKALTADCGIGSLDDRLERLRWRADALKAQRALATLERLAWDNSVSHTDREAIRSAVAALQTSPAMQVLDELNALEMIASGDVELDQAEANDLDHLFSTEDPMSRLTVAGELSRQELQDAAWAAALRWQAVANTPASPKRRQLARVANRTCRLLWEQLQVPEGAPR